MTRGRQHLIGAVRDALEAYPAGPLPADAGEAAFHAKALQRFDALAQARDVALPPGVSIAWSRRFGCTDPFCLQNRCRAHAASRAARRALVNSTGALVIGDSNRVRHPYTAGLPHGAFHDT
ncbi:hypothetical protein VDR28_01515 [Xanthomonas campestris pv. campestris]|nr:hypothetical protein [Xanthomonas campestris pv. campestris]MEB1720680.1 hypothetical protein [Xanthomonas campestris pv. campestris]MEB1845575.1 hypothetical protein [Xanthomonas campestris pv. campestris]